MIEAILAKCIHNWIEKKKKNIITKKKMMNINYSKLKKKYKNY